MRGSTATARMASFISSWPTMAEKGKGVATAHQYVMGLPPFTAGKSGGPHPRNSTQRCPGAGHGRVVAVDVRARRHHQVDDGEHQRRTHQEKGQVHDHREL